MEYGRPHLLPRPLPRPLPQLLILRTFRFRFIVGLGIVGLGTSAITFTELRLVVLKVSMGLNLKHTDRAIVPFSDTTSCHQSTV
jgi:hypothetical protein